MAIKEFLRSWRDKELKGMDKDERTNLLYENIPSIVTFYVKKGHSDQDTVNALFDRMENAKFAKTLLRILKTDDETPVELGAAVIISDFLERRHEKVGEEVVALYDEAVNKILKKRIKKVSSKAGIEKDVAKELLVIVPDKDVISDPKFVGIYVQRMLRKLYILAKDVELGLDSTKTIKKLFKILFDEELLNNIAVNVLLERRENMKNFSEKQLAVWNHMTTFALDTLEENKKKELKDLLGYYIARRMKDGEKGRDFARRVPLTQIAADTYPRLSEVVEGLADKEKFNKFL